MGKNHSSHSRIIRNILITLAGIIVLLVVLVVGAIHAITIPSVTQTIVSKVVPNFIYGEASVGRFDYHVFSTWPEADIELQNVVILSSVIEEGDTLATIDTLRASIDLGRLLKARRIDTTYWDIALGQCLIDHPCIYGQTIDTLHNWNFLIPQQEQDTTQSDSLSLNLEGIVIRDLALTYRLDTQIIATASINGSAALDSILHVQSADVNVDIPKLADALPIVPKQYLSSLHGLQLDGAIHIAARAEGVFHDSIWPTIKADVNIDHLNGYQPQTKASIDDLTLKARAQYDHQSVDSTFIQLDQLSFRSGKSTLSAKGRADYRQQRAYIDVTAKANLHLRELSRLYPTDSFRIGGRFGADIKAYFYLDDLLAQNYYDIHSSSTLSGDDIRLMVRPAHLYMGMDSLRGSLTTNMERTMRNSQRKDTALLTGRLAFKNMRVGYRRQIRAKVDRFSVMLYADDLAKDIPPTLRTFLGFNGVEASLNDTIRIKNKRFYLAGSVAPDKQHRFRPMASVSLSLDSTMTSTPSKGVSLDSTRLSLKTAPRFRAFTYDRATKTRTPIPESQHKVVSIDSLITLTNMVMEAKDPVEQYLKKFETNGHVYVKRVRLLGDDVPLRTSLSKVDATFTDDTIHLDNLRLRMGRSAISLKGEVNNVRRYLLRGKTLNADVQLKSKRIDLNQLAQATKQKPVTQAADTAVALGNMEALEHDSEQEDEQMSTNADSIQLASLIVLPKNMDVHFTAEVDTILFSEMKLMDFVGKVRLKDQALSIVNMSTSTQVGKAALDVSYICSSKDSASTAIALNMDSIQIGELIEYLPELDSVLPMLRSFKGSVRCELSAQASLDSVMNVKLPSVNASAYIRGENLVVLDGETFAQIAKNLMFNKKTENVIDTLAVELMVTNNEIEIYPFLISMDKYRVAVGGTQNFDQSFSYHIAVLKPIVLGLDINGKDFDHIRFKLVSPKFKDSNTQIGTKGNLIQQDNVNLRQKFHDAVSAQIHELQK